MGPVAALLGSLAIVVGFVYLAAAMDAPFYLACAAVVSIGVVLGTVVNARQRHH